MLKGWKPVLAIAGEEVAKRRLLFGQRQSDNPDNKDSNIFSDNMSVIEHSQERGAVAVELARHAQPPPSKISPW